MPVNIDKALIVKHACKVLEGGIICQSSSIALQKNSKCAPVGEFKIVIHVFVCLDL